MTFTWHLKLMGTIEDNMDRLHRLIQQESRGKKLKATDGDKKRALLLDDDRIFCKLFEKDVEKGGLLHLETCSTSEEFLHKLENEHFDVCIIDYDLYETTGLEVLDRVRRFSDIPALMISSSYSSIEDQDENMVFDDGVSKWEDSQEIVRHTLGISERKQELI